MSDSRPDRYARARSPYYLEQLTASCWWIEVQGYQSLLVVGERGVLLIDPLSEGRGEKILEAAAEATHLPITALAYTHHHWDHIGDARVVLDEAQRHGALEIIATQSCTDAIAEHRVEVPAPTSVLPDGGGEFMFENMTIEYGTLSGHCPDNTWFLVPSERVIQIVDMVHPGGLEFEAFGMAQDLTLYEQSLEALRQLDWDVFVAGHAELGSRADVELVLEYLRALRAATRATLERLPASGFSRAASDGKPAPLRRRDAVVSEVLAALGEQWGTWPEFGHYGWSHANAVYWQTAYFG
jgi:glyoxylase-like metal-dependent hydrolase (beta-lactamase superfamily II)